MADSEQGSCLVPAEGYPSRITTEQKERLMDFMRNHHRLAAGCESPLVKARLLKEITEQLNAVAGGCTKSEEKWYKCWKDWKCDVKKKAARLKQLSGSGRPTRGKLSETDKELLQLLRKADVTAHMSLDPLEQPTEEKPTSVERIGWDQRMDDLISACQDGNTEKLNELPSLTVKSEYGFDRQTSSRPLGSAPTESSSSSSYSPKRCRRRSQRLSESSLDNDQMVEAAIRSADSKAVEVQIREKTLAILEQRMQLEKEQARLRQELAKEELELKRRKVAAAERNASAMESVAEALIRLSSQLQTNSKPSF